MCVRLLLALLMAGTVAYLNAEEGSQYLQNTIKGLKKQMRTSNRRTVQGPEPTPIKRASNEENVPSIHLTKQELAALYETAVANGESIKLDPGDGSSKHIKAAVHELEDDDAPKKESNKEHNGYYYYYYPLKSFMDELSSSSFPHEKVKMEESNHHHNYHDHYYDHPKEYHDHPKDYYDHKDYKDYYEHKHHHHDHEHDHEHDHHHEHEEEKPQMHSHMHEHNVRIETMKTAMEMDKKKGLEPLFMAISGFIGMTLMFVLSILVLPRFDKLKPKGFKGASADMTSITRIALEAIEGRDCSERLACEAGKAANAFNLYDNRFVKLIRRIAPRSIGKQMDKIGKYTDKKFKCASIQCKRKGAAVAQSKVVKLKNKSSL